MVKEKKKTVNNNKEELKIKEWVDKPKGKKNIIMMQYEKQEGKRKHDEFA